MKRKMLLLLVIVVSMLSGSLVAIWKFCNSRQEMECRPYVEIQAAHTDWRG